jgi:hypothetical protein
MKLQWNKNNQGIESINQIVKEEVEIVLSMKGLLRLKKNLERFDEHKGKQVSDKRLDSKE